ncbi:hypothetical protein IAD21_01906 [Abditibacteriota bacterium]|nr:hypothetical protein IAD21_01906 [Abditibacteriota bacterium]
MKALEAWLVAQVEAHSLLQGLPEGIAIVMCLVMPLVFWRLRSKPNRTASARIVPRWATNCLILSWLVAAPAFALEALNAIQGRFPHNPERIQLSLLCISLGFLISSIGGTLRAFSQNRLSKSHPFPS